MKLYAERELALLDRKAGIPTPDAPPVEPAPKLSADPREAALGMTEPGRTNERAVEEMIAQYPDMADLPESARRFCRAVSAAIAPSRCPTW